MEEFNFFFTNKNIFAWQKRANTNTILLVWKKGEYEKKYKKLYWHLRTQIQIQIFVTHRLISRDSHFSCLSQFWFLLKLVTSRKNHFKLTIRGELCPLVWLWISGSMAKGLRKPSENQVGNDSLKEWFT